MKKRFGALLLVMLWVCFEGSPASGEEFFIPDDFTQIQFAIEAAEDGDIVTVRPGTYYETIRFRGKAIRVRSIEGPESTVIVGGGNSVVIFSEEEGRDSILEGFELREGTGNCDLFFCYGGGIFCVDASPTIRDCILRDNAVAFDGGGLYVRRGFPLIEDCVFENNLTKWYQGGGIYATEAQLELRRCRFLGNLSDGGGGGVVAIQTPLLVEDCEFIGNVANGNGGGIDATASDTTVRGSLFESNRCNTRGGAIRHSGGLLVVEDCTFRFNDSRGDGGAIQSKGEDTIIRDSEIRQNVAYGKGGGIHVDGGVHLLIERCVVRGNLAEVSDGGGLRAGDVPLEMRDCEFIDNEAHAGGAVQADGGGGSVAIVGSTFTRNRAVYGVGGALNLARGPVDVVNCGFFRNETVDVGGGIRSNQEDTVIANCVFSGNRAYWHGGAMDVHQSLHRVVNCTMVDNEAYLSGGGIRGNANGLVANCIVRDNHAARWPDVANRDDTWIMDLRWSNLSVWLGEQGGVFDRMPGMADRLGADLLAGTGDEDLRLTPCSPGIDASDALLMPPDRADVDGDGDVLEPIPLDYLGNPRFVDDPTVPDASGLPGGSVDRGAVEWQGVGPGCSPGVDCDANGIADHLDILNCDGDPGCLDCNGNGRPDRCDLVDSSLTFDAGIGYWRFDGDAVDLGASGIDGDLQADAEFVADRGNDSVPGLGGVPNHGALAIGENGFVRVRDRDQRFAMGESSYTIEAWVRIDQLGTMGDPSRRQYLVQRKPGDSGGSRMDYAFLVQGGNLPQGVNRRYGKPSGLSGRELVMQFGDGGADTWCATSYLEVEEVGWHHVSVAIDSEARQIRFGLDGEYDVVSYDEKARRYAFEANLIIGAHTNSSGQFNQRLRGAVDELRIVRRVMRVDELLDAWPIGTSADCNGNGRPDGCDILDGLLVDADRDGLPDECEVGVCPADLDGDGLVGGSDLGVFFVGWGTDGPGDLDGDGLVGGADLGLLFLAWGPCPIGCDASACDDDDECTLDGCHPVTGACTHLRLPGCITDPCFGNPCDDGDDCTIDECDPLTGECANLPIPDCKPNPCRGVECDDGNPCTKDFCDPATGNCVHEPIEGCDSAPCGDPAAGGCFRPNPVPNCDDLACCEAVCKIDDYCCLNAWDDYCVEIAGSICP